MTLDLTNISVKQVRIAIASVIVMAVIGAGNLYFSYQNWQDRLRLNAEREEWQRQAEMSRTMLDARATIQITLINAVSEGRSLTQAEKTQIDRLWIAAEYDIEKRPR